MPLSKMQIKILKRLQEIDNQPNNTCGIQHSDLAKELDIDLQTLMLKHLNPLKNEYVEYPLDAYVKILPEPPPAIKIDERTINKRETNINDSNNVQLSES